MLDIGQSMFLETFEQELHSHKHWLLSIQDLVHLLPHMRSNRGHGIHLAFTGLPLVKQSQCFFCFPY